MVMKLELLTAVQLQPAVAVTVTVPVPPVAGDEALVGLMEKVQVPPQSPGTFEAAVCVVPSLPTAETPIPWRAKTVQMAQRLALAFKFWSACRMPSRAFRYDGRVGVNFMPWRTSRSVVAAPSCVRKSQSVAAQISPSLWTEEPVKSA